MYALAVPAIQGPADAAVAAAASEPDPAVLAIPAIQGSMDDVASAPAPASTPIPAPALASSILLTNS